MISRYGVIPGAVYDGDCRARSTLAALDRCIHKSSGGADRLVESFGGAAGVRAALERHGARYVERQPSAWDKRVGMTCGHCREHVLGKLAAGEVCHRPNKLARDRWRSCCRPLIRLGWLRDFSTTDELVVMRTDMPDMPTDSTELLSISVRVGMRKGGAK